MTRDSVPFRHALAVALSAGLLASAPGAALAQEVVQALPDPAEAELSDALRRLARSPTSLPALLAAADASLKLDDVDAAHGFYTRAKAQAPQDGRVAAGLGVVALREGDAMMALDLFAEAEAAGENLAPLAAERGLARDLVGDNAGAQVLYRQALARSSSNEVTRRLALSQAIAGDAAASEATLLPLLQRQDQAAFRTRAFALAILGQDEEAITIAETMLPARLARRLAPFLRYMPRLTRAQQASAANLGRFPPAAQIGRDDPRIARYARGEVTVATSRAPDSRLIPGGAPLGGVSGDTQPTPVREPVVQPLPEPPAEPVQQAVVQPSPEPAAEPAPVDPPAQRASLDEIFADLPKPDELTSATTTPTAVDITRIDPPREKPAVKPVAPPPPAHPARQWVQVATGRDLAAFRWDWRRLVRSADGLLEGRSAFYTSWGQTNRLLTGPFKNVSEAQAFVTSLAEAGIDAFRFSSAEGQEIAPLQ